MDSEHRHPRISKPNDDSMRVPYGRNNILAANDVAFHEVMESGVTQARGRRSVKGRER